VQARPALLEERQYSVEIVERLDAVAGIVAPARVRPLLVALFEAGTKRHHLRPPLRPS
jgi:hypothetical protein